MPSLASLPPPDLTPCQMFLTADIVVKLVLAGLVLASVATWTILVAKALELLAARRGLRQALARAGGCATLEDFAATLRPAPQAAAVPAAPLLAAANAELELSNGLPPEGTKERVAQRLQRIQATMTRRIGRGIGVLATIGACAPFVGLFGTVWGIMNSFVGISRMQTTNLAVVAPGIAEALLATGAGLVAAIPAVVIYNALTRALAGHRAALADLSAAVWGRAAPADAQPQAAQRGGIAPWRCSSTPRTSLRRRTISMSRRSST
jgi:biopolymer transport protein ExbB